MKLMTTKRTMRDTLIAMIHQKMKSQSNLYFISADFGAPALDKLREEFPDRFINIGIAEQNLVNVATGMALEGNIVFAYAIAPFITMRCYEQLRVNCAILSQVRPMNINFVGVGAGLSYEVSGPTHHCLEDISIMRTLPSFKVYSPSDASLTESLVEKSFEIISPKYFRLDAKPFFDIERTAWNLEDGFVTTPTDSSLAVISTGFMTQTVLGAKEKLAKENIYFSHFDVFNLKGLDQPKLQKALSSFKTILSLEEAFVGKGGLDALVGGIVHQLNQERKDAIHFSALGIKDQYFFHVGDRQFLHEKNGLTEGQISQKIKELLAL